MPNLSFYTDTHIAKAVAEQIRAKGLTVIRCEEVGLATASDEEHLSYAAQAGCVLISCDQDFRDIYYLWLEAERDHAGIILFDQERHCKNIGRIVKVVTNIIELVMSHDDLVNQLIEAREYDE